MNLALHAFCCMGNSSVALPGLAGCLPYQAAIFIYVFLMQAHEEIYNITSAWQQIIAIYFYLLAWLFDSAIVDLYVREAPPRSLLQKTTRPHVL